MYTDYEKFAKLDVDFSAIGIMQCSAYERYYCTPQNAQIIGCAGVDGIHYCMIPEFGEVVFAVSPMNFGDCVHPIARNFRDLLRLLLCCGDMAALEQCYAWDEEQFKAFLIDCPITEEQKKVLNAVRQEFSLQPMESAFDYVKRLQSEFDLSRIPYTADYYDLVGNGAAPVCPAEWKVTYDGGFWDNEGDAGFEMPMGKTFRWGDELWRIPSVYLCEQGLVVDYLMEADPAEVKAFIDRWNLYDEDRICFTAEQQEQMNREHPLNVCFRGEIACNGEKLCAEHGCGTVWLPSCCRQQGTYADYSEAEQILTHYGFDQGKAWSIQRSCYRWDGAKDREISSLAVRMEREREHFSGQHFAVTAAGEKITLIHPLTGQQHLLTVQELERQQLPQDAFADLAMEYPTYTTAICYSLDPDLSEKIFRLRDCSNGDAPRPKKTAKNNTFAGPSAAAAVGIIGSVSGAAILRNAQKSGTKVYSTCSALHFEPTDQVEWRAVFSEKMMEDITIQLV